MRFILDDCRALHKKALISDEQLNTLEQLLRYKNDSEQIKLTTVQLRNLFQHELDTIINRIRVQQNKTHEATLQQSDLIAVAAGGLLGALNAWMRPSSPRGTVTSPSPHAKAPSTSVWASAFDGAQASLNVVRQRRLLDHLHIKHMSGDEFEADHIVLCVNGFMTQGGDPLGNNWSPWIGDDPRRIALYAVLWEAGDVDAWNAFCSHANENLTSPAASAHGLLTHFTGNPWHKAQDKAEQVGVLLAHVLVACPTFCRGRRVSMMGHSLGGAVLFSTLKELARLRRDGQMSVTEPLVQNVLFFAGAFVPTRDELVDISKELMQDGKIINIYSERDNVLSTLFWAVQLHGGDAIAAGCAPITNASQMQNVVNMNVSDLIPPRMINQFGHSYGLYMEAIRKRVLANLTTW